MKRAVILHGTDGTPLSNWFPWLKQKLENQGYEVWVPQLPECHTPNKGVYGEFLFGQGWDFTNNIVVGHSSGAVEVLNLLDDERLPKVKLAVAVSAWAGEVPAEYQRNFEAAGLKREQFLRTFPVAGFDFAAMRGRAENIAFLHGNDDPFCPPTQAQGLAEQLHASYATVFHGGHLGSGHAELPELWDIIKPQLYS